MNPEQHLARQICQALDRGAQGLDPAIVERLRAARERALAHRPVIAAAIVGAGGTASLHGDDAHHPIRMALAMLAMLLGFTLTYYWNGFSQANEDGAIDSALLADDLPPNAYLDRGFHTWLEKDSSPGE